MKPERWEAIERLYNAVLELEPDRREAFLREACAGDESLHREVVSLLACQPEAEGLLESPALESAAKALAQDAMAAQSVDLIGRTIAHYRVIEKIGEGGMGEVFLADDKSLHRKVALKFLPPELQQDPLAHKRFLREAHSAASLDHSFICSIHEVGEFEGKDFIVMEYVDGETLRDRLDQSLLPQKEALSIAIEVTEALEEAHGKGIIHRDLKPANIMLTRGGHAKVMDFGLAKQLIPAGVIESQEGTQTTLTEEGSAVGTLAYMSPEQLRGQPTDGRSDIWALGVVLYEMAAGARPFQGQTGFELSSAILNESPQPIPSRVPAELRAVIERCLAKSPAQRYQHTGEVRAALEAIQAGSVSPWVGWRYRLAHSRWSVVAAGVLALIILAGILVGLDVGGVRGWMAGRMGIPARAVKLAVLPFANLTGDPGQEHLSDGLTQEMIAQLGRLHPETLSVIARTSVMRYKKTEKGIDQIGRELGVGYILEGSTRRDAGRIRITAELIQVRDQTQLWAETYEREMAGILGPQAEVARKVAETLALKLLPAEQARLANVRPVNPEAYEAYLKGMQYWYKLTPEDIDTALEYFGLALKKDPNYAPAHAGLALVWIGRQQMGYTSPREGGPKAKAAARKAVELDSTLAEAHSALAIVNCFYEYDWAGGEAEFKGAIELNPNYPDARAPYSHVLMFMKRPEEAMAQIQRALELDPLNAFFQAFYGIDLQMIGRDDEALAQFRKALRTSPHLPFARGQIARTLFNQGKYAAALAEWNAIWADDRELKETLVQGFAKSDYRGAMRRVADIVAARCRTTDVGCAGPAYFYLMAGEKERTLEWLEKAFEMHDGNLPYIVSKPPIDPLRSAPRFQALLRRMNLPQ